MPKPTLTEEDYRAAAQSLGVPVAAVKAVCEVEAPRGGFYSDGQVRILFERHKFSQHTGGRFDKIRPGISNPRPGGYGKESEQHPKLFEAVRLDREAALKSASWGKFQILGENYEQAGFRTLQAFINAMHASEADHLEAFVAFVKADPIMHAALQAKDWAGFARRYNGPAYRKNRYDEKLAEAFQRYASEPDFSRVTSRVTSTEDQI